MNLILLKVIVKIVLLTTKIQISVFPMKSLKILSYSIIVLLKSINLYSKLVVFI